MTTSAVAPKSPAIDPDLTSKPWEILGISRSNWYRAWSAGQVPLPVAVPGTSRNYWRISDLRKWVSRLSPVRTRKPFYGRRKPEPTPAA
jgi:hypothetical protein